MKAQALILDLDDTIFQTRSMDPKVFTPFFDHLYLGLSPVFKQETIDQIMDELWQKTWEVVINEYNIPRSIITDAIQVLDQLELDLDISPYPDYSYLQTIQCPKFLVTTSLSSLQNSKIKALNIAHDFTKIIINDTFKEQKTKLDIFRDLMTTFNLVPETTYVIGDNADSEIRAGNALNMVTVQILRDQAVRGDNARYYISSFHELEDILK
jgi:putative hydrolase of the HAD superfamily